MEPRLYLQLSSGRDSALRERLSGSTSDLGWLVAGQYALRSRQGLGSTIDQATRLLIDPQTSRLDASLGWSAADDGKEKPTYRRLWDEFLSGIPDARAQAIRTGGLTVATGSEPLVIAENVLSFQTRALDMGRAFDEQLFEIENLPSATRRVAPDALFAPYVLISDITSLATQTMFNRVTPKTWEGRQVDRVIALHPRGLDRDRVVTSLRSTDWGSGRVWIWIPGFRDLVIPRRLGPTVLRLRSLIRTLAERGPVGLLGASFPLCTLISDGITDLAFSPHLETGRLRSGSGGPLAQSYVTKVHGWVSYDEVETYVRRCSTPAQVTEIFCAEGKCAELVEGVGINEFCALMFSRRETPKGAFAEPSSRKQQDLHALRARLQEVSLVAGLSRVDLVRILSGEARRSPFAGPAAFLSRWAAILRIEELAAA